MPALLHWLVTLDDGTCISVRGRDSVEHAWAYGIGLKTGQRIFYIYEDGSLECLTICYTNFLRNVNIAFPRPARAARGKKIIFGPKLRIPLAAAARVVADCWPLSAAASRC